ncbi:MAG: NADH-quinone oxidoreductase subunit J [Desulfomonilaceae bacterium]
MEALIFYILSAITVASAFFVVFLRRPMHNVLFMILTMIGLAGLFIMLQAEFVAMVQLIVYAGAVMVLFLFVIMLLNLDQVRLPIDPRALRSWIGVALAVAVPVLLVPILKAFVPSGKAAVEKAVQMSNTQIIAKALFTTYLLPFEIASILLLAAIIGTVILARKRS